MKIAVKHTMRSKGVAYCGSPMTESDYNGRECQMCKAKLEYSYTYTLQSKGELLEALHKAGIFFNPYGDNQNDGMAEISWPRAWKAAQAVHGDMEFGAEMPCTFDDNGFSIVVLDQDMYIEDVMQLTTAQAVNRIAGFIAGQYWADVASIANREEV